WLEMVAQCDPAGDLPLLCNWRHHRIRRFLECQHRRRVGLVGPDASHRAGARRLYRGDDGRGRLSAHRTRHCGHVALCDFLQPRSLAPALPLRRAPFPAGLRGTPMLEAAQKPTITAKTVLDLSHIQQAFARPNGEPSVILDDISFSLREGEIVGVLGRSGCGKSTLLRIAAGLMRPTSGKVTYQGNGMDRPVKGIAMVFQTFALFPWLTVLENVMAGLDALGMKEAQAREKAVAAIDLIGLDGFETAYPRELSGGMRQRVGFARALVVDPIILLMDEPFSALDVLTAETLRADFIDLWTEGKLGIKSVMLVTHNIEEAVTLCDRIIVLAPDPGRIAAELEVPLPQPRERLAPAFREIVDDIYARMTAGRGPSTGNKDKPALAGLALRLPVVSSHRIVGLLDMLAAPPFDGKADLRVL